MFKGLPCQKEIQLATYHFNRNVRHENLPSFSEISFVNLKHSLMKMVFKDLTSLAGNLLCFLKSCCKNSYFFI